MSDRYKYEIDETNVIRVWDNELPNELGAPFLFQPTHPDGTEWVDKAAAEAWVAEFIQEMLKPPVDEVIEAEIVE